MSQHHHANDDDDDGDDVVVLHVCATPYCTNCTELEFDEDVGEYYCSTCMERYRRALDEGMETLLSDDDLVVVQTIFEAFDTGRKGYWDFRDYVSYSEATQALRREASHGDDDADDHHHGENLHLRNDIELRDYLRDEFEVDTELVVPVDKRSGHRMSFATLEEVEAEALRKKREELAGKPTSPAEKVHVVTLLVLQRLYGGYLYNGVNALRDDAEHLAEEGVISSLDRLE
jgi:hypothetical protein